MTTRRRAVRGCLRFTLALTTVIAATAAANADEIALSGRRNGTLHGPSIRGGGLVSFSLFRAIGADCDSGLNAKPCMRDGPAHVVAGAGLRNAGHGTVRLRGVPPGATLEAVYLYFGLIEDPLFAGGGLWELGFEGRPIRARYIAGGGHHCWEVAAGALLPGVATLYRADVTPFLSPAINGDYAVFGVPSGTTDRSDPFDCPLVSCTPTLPLAQGATLVVVYRHPDVAAGNVVYIHEARGTVPFLAAGLTVHHNLLPPVSPGWRQLRVSNIGGDGQTRDPDPSFRPVAPFSTHLSLGVDAAWIRGTPSEIEPNTDWIGLDGGTVPQLWDSRTTRIDRSELGAAAIAPIHQYVLHYDAGADPTRDYDCVNPSVDVLEVIAD